MLISTVENLCEKELMEMNCFRLGEECWLLMSIATATVVTLGLKRGKYILMFKAISSNNLRSSVSFMSSAAVPPSFGGFVGASRDAPGLHKSIFTLHKKGAGSTEMAKIDASRVTTQGQCTCICAAWQLTLS